MAAFVAMALSACGDKKAQQKVVPATVAIAPTVTAASAVSTLKGAPPLVVMIAGPDRYLLATAASWDKLGKRELAKGPVKVHPTQVKGVLARAVETFAMGQPPEENLAHAGEESLIDLSSEPECKDGIDLHSTYVASDDDPPPPEEEDSPDDGALIEPEVGKMGLPESDRAEGQYKMRGPDPDPAVPSSTKVTPERRISGFPGTGPVTWECRDSLASGTRRAQARGDIDLDGSLDGKPAALILVEPHAAAGLLVDAVETSRGGAIGVTYQGAIRPLAMRFDEPSGTEKIKPPAWIEVRVLASGFEIGGPSVSAAKAVPNLAALGAALAEVRTRDKLDAHLPIDVLVADATEAQALVDVLVALVEAKAGVVGLGHVPK
jgi:hypothetical protein